MRYEPGLRDCVMASTLTMLTTAWLMVSCTTTPGVPKTPAQAVFELKSAEGAALAIAARYDALTPCTPSQPSVTNLCAQPAIVAQIKGADLVAAKAIDAAETATRTAGYPASTQQTLIDTATAALTALTTATASLPVK